MPPTTHMDWTGTILVSMVTMLAVIASIVRDLRIYRRLGAARARAARPAPAAAATSTTIIRPQPAAEARPAALAGAVGDPDPIHELALRLGALRVLGLDHVRTAHPLFKGEVAASAAVGSVTPGAALLFSEPALLAGAPPVPAPPKRRPRHGKMRSTASLRLVVTRTAGPQA